MANTAACSTRSTPKRLIQYTAGEKVSKIGGSCRKSSFQEAVVHGAVRFDLYPQKRGSNGIQIDTKKPGQEADTPTLLSWRILLCETVLLSERSASRFRSIPFWWFADAGIPCRLIGRRLGFFVGGVPRSFSMSARYYPACSSSCTHPRSLLLGILSRIAVFSVDAGFFSLSSTAFRLL